METQDERIPLARVPVISRRLRFELTVAWFGAEDERTQMTRDFDTLAAIYAWIESGSETSSRGLVVYSLVDRRDATEWGDADVWDLLRAHRRSSYDASKSLAATVAAAWVGRPA